MTAEPGLSPSTARLRCGIVLRTEEEACLIIRHGQLLSARYATGFPAPRSQRVSPGHLVAAATGPDGREAVVFRWYDAVVLEEDGAQVRLWEPSHGDVVAQARNPQQRRRPGTRAYLSAGLPGAEWWVAGPAVAEAGDADVELDEVERFCSEHGLWDRSG